MAIQFLFKLKGWVVRELLLRLKFRAVLVRTG